MAQPNWITPLGTLGTFPSNVLLTINLNASPIFPATFVKYKLLNGSLPETMTLDSYGTITGITNAVNADTEFVFTVRVTDEFLNIKDRTFSITVTAATLPKFTESNGVILTVYDSTYVNYQVLHTVPSALGTPTVLLTSGELPPGLTIDETGTIKGYAEAPFTNNGTPTRIKYYFTLTLISNQSKNTANYSIEIINFQLDNPPNTRVPVILNSAPLVNAPLEIEKFSDFYVNKLTLPIIKSGDYITFKIIGYDFDGSTIRYLFSSMPPGLVGDPNTGWISGTPIINKGLSSFQFQVSVQKTSNNLKSQPVTFTAVISNEVISDIVWGTDSNLGIIFNNTVSDLGITAKSAQPLIYRVVSGSLPSSLELASDGQILGKVSFNPTAELLEAGASTTFTFAVEAISPNYPLVKSTKTFTLTVYQFYSIPTENIYFKATPSLTDRRIINSLLTDDTLIAPENVYRPYDKNFGKASNVIFVHVFGMNVNTIESYIQSVQTNHYNRTVILGELKTAVARDDAGNVLYEVVYSQVQDQLTNNAGESLPQNIHWSRPISKQLGPWITSTGEVYTAFDTNIRGQRAYFDSLSPGYVQELYPASFINMRNETADILGQTFESKLLPRWMATQQNDGNILGYIQAWVVCYTKPGKAETVLNTINSAWKYKLNEINFEVDRYSIDKSGTFDYNQYLTEPSWTRLPSATLGEGDSDAQDFYALFPQKTILPK